jgi:hypothetical protein
MGQERCEGDSTRTKAADNVSDALYRCVDLGVDHGRHRALKNEKLSTGDILMRDNTGGQTLKAPNGDRIDWFGPGELFFTSNDGTVRAPEYQRTYASLPEVTFSTVGPVTVEERAGVSTIKYPNGDKVVIDGDGFASIKRGKKNANLHEVSPDPLEIVPAQPKKNA